MTFREKLQKEHPRAVSDKFVGGCSMCPSDYKYEKAVPYEACITMYLTCEKCWNREIPGTEEKTIKNISDNGWEFICSECGVNLIDFTGKKCNEDKEYYLEFFNCSYCPNCGKKVAK